MKIYLSILISLILAGCSSTEKSIPQSILLNDIWVLGSLNGQTISSNEFPNQFPQLEFNDSAKSLTGFTGCNNLRGTYKINENEITFSPFATTKMYCQGVNENEFLHAMEGINNYKIENLKLYLYKDENIKLIFKKVD